MTENSEFERQSAGSDGPRRPMTEVIEQLTASVERLVTTSAEHAEALARVDDEIQRLHHWMTTESDSLDSDKQFRELIEAVSRRIDTLAANVSQIQQLITIDGTRDRRQLADVANEVRALARTVEAQQTRFDALAEQVRRDRQEGSPLAARIDELDRTVTAFTERVRQVDEQHRRTEASLIALEERDGKLERESARLDQWQKLAEVRWSRQLADWEQQLEQWRDELNEKVRLITTLSQQIPSIAESARVLGERSDQLERRLESLWPALHRLESAIALHREQVTQVSTRLDGQQQRMDEVVSSTWQATERIARIGGSFDDLGQQLARERVRIDEVRSLAEGADQRYAQLLQAVEALQQRVRAVEASQDARWAEVDERIAMLQQSVQATLHRIERRQFASRERELRLIQAEVRELAEVLGLGIADQITSLPDGQPGHPVT